MGNAQGKEGSQQEVRMKPGFYVCGGGGNFNCQYWDDINGCWQDQTDALSCPFFKDAGDEDLEPLEDELEGKE